MADGTRRVAVTSERAFTADDGKVRTLQLASWFSIDYSDSSASGPVILRIFLPEGGTFRQVYSSASDKRFHIPRSALEEIGKGASTVFIPEPDWTDDTPGAHSLIAVARGENGEPSVKTSHRRANCICGRGCRSACNASLSH